MKRNIIIVFILTLLILNNTTAQIISKTAPVNPDFLEYLDLKKQGKLKMYTEDGYRLDLIPSPIKPHFKTVHSFSKLKRLKDFQEKFDLRDSSWVTSAKDQESGTFGGNCVAFSTMGSLESLFLKYGFGEYDLSEQNLAACYGFEWGYGEGATAAMPTAYMSRFSGPVLESEDPYNMDIHDCKGDIQPLAYIPEARWLPKDMDLIKQTLMHYGALVVSVHYDETKFNSTDNTYYYDGDGKPNHAFLVCGWDDDMVTAGGTGAWIIKNSWGTGWADNGFLYVSYNDTKIMEDVIYYPTKWETDDIDYLHMYDYLGATVSRGLATTATLYDYAQGLVKFNALPRQLITKIGTYIMAQGTIIDIDVYDDFDGTKHLSNKIDSIHNIYIEFPGYYTFDLPFEIFGDFYVKIRYYTPDYYFPLPVEQYADVDDEAWADPQIDKNVNWFSTDDTSWMMMDTLSEPANLCIRAYGRDLDGLQATISSDKTISCINSPVEYSAYATDEVTSYSWNFGQDASPADATIEGPHQVTYSTPGPKHVSLTVTGPSGTDTVMRYGIVDIVEDIRVNVMDTIIRVPVRRAVELKAYGADTYTWSPSDNLNTTEGSIVILTPPSDDTLTYSVTGTQGSCTASNNITVIAKPRPVNDDVCEAILLHPGGWIGGFTNRNATVEDNEPAPEQGDCSAPMYWCVELEGKLQHSVWFYYIGPETGIVSFKVEGFDTQIAVYKADTCTDILNGNAVLIAANDDYYDAEADETYLWSAIEVIAAIPGAKYFLQLDGSFGGEEGNFHIIFVSYPLSDHENSHEILIGKDVLVYPNPSVGEYTIIIADPIYGQVNIQAYDTNGKLILSRQYDQSGKEFQTTLDLSDQPAGIYNVRIIKGNTVYNRRVIKQ